METIVGRAAGLDVHKAQVTACVRVPGLRGGRAQEVAEFSTTVRGLLSLRDWLQAHAVTQQSTVTPSSRAAETLCGDSG